MNLVYQKKAAELAGVSKQAINDIKKKGTYNFFVDKKVDIDSPAWKNYMHDRKSNKDNFPKKEKQVNQENDEPIAIPKKQINVIIGSDTGEVKDEQKDIIVDREGSKQRNRLTGGIDLESYITGDITITDIKKITEIQKLELEMKIRYGEFIPVEMVIDIIETMNQNVRAHFTDLPRRVSERIANSLEKVGMEKQIEEIIAEPVEKGIQAIKKEMKKTLKVKLDVK